MSQKRLRVPLMIDILSTNIMTRNNYQWNKVLERINHIQKNS